MRALSIRLAGRLAPRNPAYVLPALRNHLQQLLTDMEQSPDSRQREGTPSLCIPGVWGGVGSGPALRIAVIIRCG